MKTPDTIPFPQTTKTIVDFAPDLPRPAVVCTLVSVAGSAPQEVGSRLWASAERFEGTLGGGRFEAEVLEHARAMLGDPKAAPHLKEWTLCRELGQCCGGRVQVFFEPVRRSRTVHVFGGGHVARALAHVLAGSPVAVVLVDERPGWGSPEGLPAGVDARREPPLDYARRRTWAPDDAACVMTHSHDLDFELVRHLAGRPVGYLGLIGSEHKARVFRARLQAASPGLTADAVDELWESKVRCPIGGSLPSKNPKVIAAAVAMELYKEWALA